MDQRRHPFGAGDRPRLHVPDLSADLQVGPAVGSPEDVPGGGVDVAHLALDHHQDVHILEDCELTTALAHGVDHPVLAYSAPQTVGEVPGEGQLLVADQDSYSLITVRGVVMPASTSP